MLKNKMIYKIVPIFLIVSFLFTACDVPDISEFTAQSSEMTRGIRKGVKDTESVIKALSIRDDLYSGAQLAEVKTKLAEYQKAVKPTLKALDSLDAYLEALNALAQANKKSEVNSGAVVNSVTGLVDAVAGIKLAGTAVNIATGLLTLAEQFRTAKAFKDRVNIASKIVEGEYVPKLDSMGQPVSDKNGKPVMVKACTDKTKGEIDAILKDGSPNKEKRVADKGCGVVDFIKFNIEELKTINNTTSNLLYTRFRSKHSVVISLYKQLNDNNENLENEKEGLFNFLNLFTIVKEDYDNSLTDSAAIGRRIRLLKDEIDKISALDAGLASSITSAIRSSNCGGQCNEVRQLIDKNFNSFPEFLQTDECQQPGNTGLQVCQFYTNVVERIDSNQFVIVTGIIAPKLEARNKELSARIDLNNSDLQRITPTYNRVMAEIKLIKDRQEQLSTLLDAGTNALDAWTDSHANLRVVVNTKKPLTVSRLVSKVREIWEIINKAPEDEN
jgi:hypothetical protein